MTKAGTATSPLRLVAAGTGLALTLVLTLAGCSVDGLALGSSNQGDAGASSAPASAVASTAASSDPNPSAPDPSASSSGSSGSPSVAPVAAPSPNASGLIDGPAFTAWLTTAARRAAGAHMVMSAQGTQGSVSAVGDIRMSATGVEENVVMKVGAQSMRLLLLSDGLYLSMSTVKLPAGKSWILISATGTDQLSAAMRPMFQTLQANSMSAVGAESMKGVAVKRVGVTTLGGTPVVRYAFSNTQAQIEAALRLVPTANRAKARAALAGMRSSVTMLVDADGLTRQVVTTTTQKGRRSTSTVTYSRWGRPVSITAPPASEVADASTLD